MAAEPLLKSKTQLKTSGKTNAAAHLDQIVQDIDKVKSLDELLSYVSTVSKWSTMRHESRHHAYIGQLQRALHIMQECNARMQSQPVYRTLTLLSNLERTMSSSGEDDLLLQLLKLFAVTVDQYLDPVPSANVMKGFGEGLASLCQKELVVPGSGEKIRYNMWGRLALFPKRDYVREAKPMLDDAEAVFQKTIETDFENFFTSSGARGIVGGYFSRVFEHCIDNGQYGWLDNATILKACYQEQKTCLHWTAMGPLLDILLDRNALTIKELVVDDPENRFPLEELGTVVMPRFTDKLAMLLSLLQNQVKEVDDLKAKILAGCMSAAITGGQVLMGLATKYANHAQASGGGNGTIV